MMTRRGLLAAGCGVVLGAAASAGAGPAPTAPGTDRGVPGSTGGGSAATDGILRRRIPSTGELLPAVGLGSWQTFDVDPGEIASVQPVLARFLARGGRVVDSSPMYGRAEAAIGAMLTAIRRADPAAPAPFLATKVWTRGQREGEAQMRRSLERLAAPRLDLMQIHNLLDWKLHLKTLRAWKDAGTFRYIGVTHYDRGAFAELEQIIRRERIDFVQLPYSAGEREADKRLLPAAAAAGVAVLVMEPFASGALFGRVKGRPVPAWAAEVDCASWAQLFLKFILGHPAVTCPIPATRKVAHLDDNMGAMRGRLPDEALRARIAREVE